MCVCVFVCAAATPMEVAATPSQCLSKLLFFTLTQFNEFVKITFGTLCLLIDDVAGRFLPPYANPAYLPTPLHDQHLARGLDFDFKRVLPNEIQFASIVLILLLALA